MANTRLKVGDYEAWMVIENKEVEHYGIKVNEETNDATCWIASTAGKHFGLWVASHHHRFDCIAKLYLDGSEICRTTLRKSTKEPRLIKEVLAGGGLVRPLLFGVVHLTDDESVLTQSYEELGTIEIRIYRVTGYTERVVRGPSSRPEDTIQAPDKIHERAKKSVTHRVSFGQIQATSCVLCKPSYTQKEQVASFVFRYRSLDMLRAQGIVRCNPSPVETRVVAVSSESVPASSGLVPRKRKVEVAEEEEKCAVEVDSDEEEDKRKEAQLEAELQRLRKARLDRRQAKKVKCEPKSEPVPVFLPGEVIDLTI